MNLLCCKQKVHCNRVWLYDVFSVKMQHDMCAILSFNTTKQSQKLLRKVIQPLAPDMADFWLSDWMTVDLYYSRSFFFFRETGSNRLVSRTFYLVSSCVQPGLTLKHLFCCYGAILQEKNGKNNPICLPYLMIQIIWRLVWMHNMKMHFWAS